MRFETGTWGADHCAFRTNCKQWLLRIISEGLHITMVIKGTICPTTGFKHRKKLSCWPYSTRSMREIRRVVKEIEKPLSGKWIPKFISPTCAINEEKNRTNPAIFVDPQSHWGYDRPTVQGKSSLVLKLSQTAEQLPIYWIFGVQFGLWKIEVLTCTYRIIMIASQISYFHLPKAELTNENSTAEF